MKKKVRVKVSRPVTLNELTFSVICLGCFENIEAGVLYAVHDDGTVTHCSKVCFKLERDRREAFKDEYNNVL